MGSEPGHLAAQARLSGSREQPQRNGSSDLSSPPSKAARVRWATPQQCPPQPEHRAAPSSCHRSRNSRRRCRRSAPEPTQQAWPNLDWTFSGDVERRRWAVAASRCIPALEVAWVPGCARMTEGGVREAGAGLGAHHGEIPATSAGMTDLSARLRSASSARTMSRRRVCRGSEAQ